MTAETPVVLAAVCDKSTLGLCSVYLRGGYDTAKNVYTALQSSSEGAQGRSRRLGNETKQDDPHCKQILRCMLQYLLGSGRFKFRHATYLFCVDRTMNRRWMTLCKRFWRRSTNGER